MERHDPARGRPFRHEIYSRALISLAAVAVCVLIWGGAVYTTAPSPAQLCTRLFFLAGGPEVALQQVRRAQCEASYEVRRTQRGWLGFVVLGRCVQAANSLSDAGQC